LVSSLELVVTTAFIAVMSAVVSLLVGYPMGHWVASLGRFKRLVTSVLVVPFLLPAFLVGLSLRPLLGDGLDRPGVGLFALIGAHVLMNAGFIALVSAASMIPREQYEAAELDGATRGHIRWHIQLPQQLPALSAAGLLVALYSATSYGLVITLGQGSLRTLETEIVSSALQRLDLPTAGLLAALQSVLTVGFFLVARRLGARPTALFGEGEQSSGTSWLGMVLGVILLGTIAWLVWGVFSRAVNPEPGLWENLMNLSGRGTRDILNLSVVDAVGNSLRNLVVAGVVSLGLAWWLSKKKIGLLVLFPLGISPVVIGLSALVISGYLPSVVAGSWILLPLVQSVFLTPLAFQIIAPARRSLSPDIMEAARLDGANSMQLVGLIELPSLRKPILVAASLVGLGSLGEFGAASFLTYGSNQTLPLVMFRLMSRPGVENLGMAMTAASVFILLALGVVWLMSGAQSETLRRRSRALVE